MEAQTQRPPYHGRNRLCGVGPAITTSGAVTDRFGVGANYGALAFVIANLGYGPNLSSTIDLENLRHWGSGPSF
jgi:hypothetical protein